MTAGDYRANPDNFCYRHPDRQSFVLCQRCLRTICPECQTQMPVGVICPECKKEQESAQQRVAPVTRMKRRAVSFGRTSNHTATLVIITVTTIISALQLFPGVGRPITQALALIPPYLYPDLVGRFEPWRLLSYALVHSGIWHLLLNMFALWLIGRSLEPLLGRLRFVTLYVLSTLGGAVMTVYFGFETGVVGASGGIFGLFAALLVIGRHLNANIRGIAIVLGINLLLTFVGPLLSDSIRISWQAHVGGLLVGALVAFIFTRTRTQRQQALQTILLSGVAVGLIALVVVRGALLA